MRILGISALFHDSAAALVDGGRVVAAVQEERLSRKKNDARLPLEAARECLAQGGLELADVDWVVFYEKPIAKFDRILQTSLGAWPRGILRFTRAMRTWLGDRLWLEGRLARELGTSADRILFSDHHLSHAASAFFPSPLERAAVLTVDGVGEWTTSAIHHATTGDDGRARLATVARQRFPGSMGLLYSAITAYLGFEVNVGEYMVMGLAAYGEPRFLPELSRVARLGPAGELALDMRYFAFHRSDAQSFSPRLEALLGPARDPATPIDLDTAEGRRLADVAASVQRLCEDYLVAAAREARRVTGEADLCLAGGVALNCVANARVAREAGFDRVVVHPAAGDAGGALGAALLVANALGEPRDRATLSPQLGRAWADEEVRGFLRDVRVRHTAFDDDDALVTEVARRLARGEVGGWFQGGSEWGPRALGGRSILADARDPGMADRVNARVKYREPFRPFAPAALADDAHRFFALDGGRYEGLTPHMLAVVPLTDAGRAELPAVCHADGTARVQTVDSRHHPRFRALLEAFRAETGVGVLLNTSLNLKGEPICGSPVDALATFDRSDLDFLVVERCLVDKRAA
ncbi:MAG: hypothetical protein KC635_13540 [Myxococcales bacterium]|nr:hypothetical protein [Myxococcales bacterium]MCB9731431.1 carbamoyl transferase [Deltaproteobacteria bacterium]